MQTKDFKGQNLRGRSFKNQDLTGADFSDCDLRGVDFSFANLTDAKFCNARMGRTLKAGSVLLPFQLVIGFIAGIIVLTTNSVSFSMAQSGLKIFNINLDTYQFVCFIVFSLLFASVLGIAVVRQRWDYIVSFFGLLIIVTGILGGISITGGALGGALSVAGIGFTVLVITLVVTVARVLAGTLALSVALIVLITIAFGAEGSFQISTSQIRAALGGVVYIILGIYLGWRATTKEESQLLLLRDWSVKIACLRGTQFAFTTLQSVDFSNADLKYARFKNAKISNCNFQNTKNHHLALTDDTPLEPRKVRDLVIDGIISDKNFSTLDLRGLDFSGLDLREFDFSHADLSGANLNHTQLTGATLEGWNIDTETCLDNIDCEYYYYLEDGEEKRMPPKGEVYEEGEFTRIFQKIANTIDFIIHNEIELAAIKLAVEKIRADRGKEDIRVQTIEEKDGFKVVKITVPKTEDRGILYHQIKILKRDYEVKVQVSNAEEHVRIEDYESQINNLQGQVEKLRDALVAIVKPITVAIVKPITIKNIHATNYIEGDVNGGNIAGNDIQITPP